MHIQIKQLFLAGTLVQDLETSLKKATRLCHSLRMANKALLGFKNHRLVTPGKQLLNKLSVSNRSQSYIYSDPYY